MCLLAAPGIFIRRGKVLELFGNLSLFVEIAVVIGDVVVGVFFLVGTEGNDVVERIAANFTGIAIDPLTSPIILRFGMSISVRVRSD